MISFKHCLSNHDGYGSSSQDFVSALRMMRFISSGVAGIKFNNGSFKKTPLFAVSVGLDGDNVVVELTMPVRILSVLLLKNCEN